MGFLDKAKAAASDLAAKADTAMAGSGLGGPGSTPGGQPDRLFRDLGVLAYLEATNREASAGERERLVSSLREAESRGAIPSFALQSAAGPGSVPPPPGAAGATSSPPPPPGSRSAMPTPDSPASTPPPSPGTPASAPPTTSPPPPPPPWAGGSGTTGTD